MSGCIVGLLSGNWLRVRLAAPTPTGPTKTRQLLQSFDSFHFVFPLYLPYRWFSSFLFLLHLHKNEMHHEVKSPTEVSPYPRSRRYIFGTNWWLFKHIDSPPPPTRFQPIKKRFIGLSPFLLRILRLSRVFCIMPLVRFSFFLFKYDFELLNDRRLCRSR